MAVGENPGIMMHTGPPWEPMQLLPEQEQQVYAPNSSRSTFETLLSLAWKKVNFNIYSFVLKRLTSYLLLRACTMDAFFGGWGDGVGGTLDFRAKPITHPPNFRRAKCGEN